ncbi:beta-lactamase/transpeptidase-like protein [Annulohypoxylon maeteangense]|uniref:beta-lactamase/transpeptidase-like protein n=1 Tax=Annulohypoxylon maeteangense TaxID=1927788 RepID=UPI002008A123|nr:beta-lactamase/transpeptidase-like protein [Annulohypoxylon maeteangense]KAI0881841.1 beta-lactamase/transpeptidase-like protein [Annulohypoxylon maeteangense]
MKLIRFLLGVCPLYITLIDDVFAAKNNHCPPLGPVLPAPTNPSSNPAVQSAVSALQQTFDGITENFNGTALSIGVKSIHETASFANVHYTPPILDPRGSSHIDSSTVYRIGSVSKLILMVALKTTGVRWEDPVTNYLPRLRELKKQQSSPIDRMTTVDWDDITVWALATHTSGIGSDLILDMGSFPVDWTKLGLPPAREHFNCGVLDGLPPCQEKDFWDNFGKRYPVFSPYTSPLYSNTAFYILSLVVQAIAGYSYSQYVQKHILEPLGMRDTTFAKPNDTLGAISLNDTFWDATLGIDDPAGGFYSSTHDLLTLGEAILTNKFSSPTQTHRWLGPATLTSSIGMFVGAPWEIIRADNVTLDQRLVEFYTKGGDGGTYHAMFAVVPDYDLVISILASGPESSSNLVQQLFSQVITTLLPAVEAAGKDEARSAFAGTYVNEETNSTITLSVDDEGPGLNITNWIVRGTDVPSHWLNYTSGISSGFSNTHVSTRLYPTGLTNGSRTAWRVAVDLGTPEEIAQADAQLFWPQANCMTWITMDRLVYEYRALDEMIFDLVLGDSDVEANVELVGFQTTLQRITPFQNLREL